MDSQYRVPVVWSVPGAFLARLQRPVPTPRQRQNLFAIARLQPLMVDRTTAAALFGMTAAAYSKAERKGLVPAMNAVGRVSIHALRQAALRLDGFHGVELKEDPDQALARWEAENAN